MFKRRHLISCLAALGALLAPVSSVHAETVDPAVGVAVKIYAKGAVNSAPASLQVSGTFLPDVPGQADLYVSNNSSTTTQGTTLTTVLGASGFVRVEPGKTYTVYVNAPAITNGELNIVAPPGYRVVLNHLVRSRVVFSGLLNAVFELQPLGANHPGLAGMASSTPGDEIDWRISLGSLRNGGSAGELALIDTGAKASWSPVFTPARLFHEATSDEVWVYRPNNTIRQIRSNQVVIDVVTLTATSYEIRCYHPAQERPQQIPNSDESTFVGQPFVTYRVERDATDTSLRIYKEVRNVVDWLATNLPVARREVLKLSRSGSWPAFTWEKTDWTLDGETPLATTTVQSSGTTASRTETVQVTGGAGTAFALTRNFTVPQVNGVSVIGEVLASETVGTATGVTSSFDYYTDTADFGSLGYVKSATMPGGNWVAYDYYPTDVTTGARGGRVKYSYRPYLNAPATITKSVAQGEVTYYEYTNDVFGTPTRSSLVQHSVNGVVTSKTVTAYNDSRGTANGHAIAQTTKSQYSSSVVSLVTTVLAYRADTSDAMIRGQVHSITAHDGVRQSFAYQRGSWNGSAFTAGGSGVGTGTASRVVTITGVNRNSGQGDISTIDGYQLDSVCLVDGKSTKDVTIRNDSALVVRTESHIWKNYVWQLVSYTNFSYDFAGRLTSRTGSNGATYTAVYDGGLKTSETDEAGVTTTFTYDAHGRLSISTRTGSGAIAAVATKYTYDAAGHVTKQEIGYGQAGVSTIQRQFDDAGRPTQDTPPGGYGALAYGYNVANRTATTTRADGSTIITTDYLDGRRASTTGTGTVPEYHTYGVESDGRRWHQTNVGTSTSPRWTKSWNDWLGRGIKSESPGFTGQPNIVAENFYDGGGHLTKTTKTGYAPTLLEYNSLGEVSRSGLDYNNNGSLDLASSDRITETDSYLESYNGAWWMRTDTRTYPKLGLNTVVVTSTSRTRLTGHVVNRLSETQGIDAEGNVTTQIVDVNRSARTSVATTTRSGIANSMVENTVNGFSTSVRSFDGLTTTKTYDSLLRLSAVTDSRGNTTANSYITGTAMVQSVTNQAGNTSVTLYDTVGLVSAQRDPKNFYTRYAYNLRGQVIRQWGDGAMPVEYGYDATYGARTSMSTYRGGSGWDGTTWPAAPGTADTTTWTYDGPSGLLTAKTDALGRTASQTYNVRGQTATRELARTVLYGANIGQRVKTTYAYDSATGELLSQTYNDDTPAVTYTYGRTGQVETISDVTGLRDLVYDPAKPWRMVAEAQSSFYNGRVLTRLYDESGSIGRVRGFQLGASSGSNSDLEQTFGFTTVGRFETITSNSLGNTGGARTFRYGYLANSALLQSLSIDGNHPFTITRSYEAQRDVITGLDSKWSTALRTGYAYTYDERGQRSKVVQSGDAFSDYGDVTSQQFAYNGRGELTSAIGYLGSDTTLANKQLPGRRHEYSYDTAGNRQWSNRTGVDAMRDDYTTNALNQYVSRENNTVPLSGTAAADTTVAVQGGTMAPVAAGRQGRYWNDEVTVNNNSNPLAPNPWRGALTIFTAKAGASGSPDVYKVESRMAEIAARLQNFTYDNDGNLTSDGLVDYQWDAENRLVRMETSSMARSWNFPHRLLEFRYDYMGRRVQKRVIDVTLNAEISSRRFLYDGWNLVAEYAAPGGTTCGALLRSYTWGLDIALSMSNAGGVGALLQIADHPSGKTYLPTYDGNGNIASLVNAASGALAAVYEYSPYGEPLRAQVLDATVTDNPFRFSTKFTDVETGLVYYGHRYYDPKNGRFINRDPIEETGGINLYGFCGNNAINLWDYLGMVPPATITTTITAPNGQSTSQTMYWRNGGYGPGYYSTPAPANDCSEPTDGNGNEGGEFFGDDTNSSGGNDGGPTTLSVAGSTAPYSGPIAGPLPATGGPTTLSVAGSTAPYSGPIAGPLPATAGIVLAAPAGLLPPATSGSIAQAGTAITATSGSGLAGVITIPAVVVIGLLLPQNPTAGPNGSDLPKGGLTGTTFAPTTVTLPTVVNSSAGGYTFPSVEELARRLGIPVKDFHGDNGVKKEILQSFPEEMRAIGSTNPNIGVDQSGNIILQNPANGRTAPTNVPLANFRPGGG